MRVTEFELTRRPDQVAWLIMRVIHCQIWYFRHDEIAWTRDLSLAWCFAAREEAWAIKLKLGNAFLLIHGGAS